MLFAQDATVTTQLKIIGNALPINNYNILSVLNTPTCNVNNTCSLIVTLVANVTANDTKHKIEQLMILQDSGQNR